MKMQIGWVVLGGMFAFGAIPVVAKNITIFDRQSHPSFFHTGTGAGSEDGEVEPSSVPGQEWDLEQMRLHGTTLKIIGGYDFAVGQGGYKPGDLFIDVNGDATWGTPIDANGLQYGMVNNSSFDFDYVVHFTKNTLGQWLNYEVLKISDATLLEVKFVQNSASNPWRYKMGGSLITSGAAGFMSGITDAQAFGALGGTHHSLDVDIGFLGADLTSQTLFKYTYECGNDNIVGRVPDGGNTLMLLGSCLSGLVFMTRRMKAKV